MFRRVIGVILGIAVLAVALGSEAAWGQSTDMSRRSMGNLSADPPRRSMGNFPPGHPNYYSEHGVQPSHSDRRSSGRATVVIPNPSYPGWYYPAVPAYPVPVYPPYGRGHIYVPAPGYYYSPGYVPYYYRPGYYVPRYPYVF